MSQRGATAAMASTRGTGNATTAPTTNRRRRTDEARWGIGGMGLGEFTLPKLSSGCLQLQPLIGSVVACCSVGVSITYQHRNIVR
eukprot:scaffold20942_cov59-Phaeocystis_antarctica.AAC.1